MVVNGIHSSLLPLSLALTRNILLEIYYIPSREPNMTDQATLPPEIATQNKGPGILAAIITVSIISTLFVVGRLFVRVKIIEKLYLDDYLIILSTVSSLPGSTMRCAYALSWACCLTYLTDMWLACRGLLLCRRRQRQWKAFRRAFNGSEIWSHFMDHGGLLARDHVLRPAQVCCRCSPDTHTERL